MYLSGIDGIMKAMDYFTAIQERFSTRPRPALILMAVLPALIATAVYVNTLANEFVADDGVMMKQLFEKSGPQGIELVRARHGLTMAVHALDKRLWGPWAPGFHLTNVLLHALASALAAYLGLVLTRSKTVGLLCGLLFAAHPVHTEVVASFVNRKDILAFIFISLTLVFWLKTHSRRLFYIASFVCFGLALSSKEVAAAGLIFMLPAADMLPGFGHDNRIRKRLRVGLLRLLPFLLIGSIATIVYAGDISEFFSPERIQISTEYLMLSYGPVLPTVFAGIPKIAELLLFPMALSADHTPNLQSSFTHPSVLLGMAMAVLWILGTIALARRTPIGGYAMAWVLLMYLPCSNIVPLTQFFVAERYLYVPSFGVCLLLALGAERAISYTRARGLRLIRISIVCLVILTIGAGATRSAIRNRDWRDECTLWSSAIEAGSKTWRPHCYLGILNMYRGDLDGAVRELRLSVKAHPLCPKPRFWLGMALERQGNLEEALDEYRGLLELFADHLDGRCAVARVLLQLGRHAEAIEANKDVLKLKQDARALSDLSWLLSTAPDRSLRDGKEAVRLARLVNIATDYSDPRQLTVLAAAWIEVGAKQRAEEVERDAVNIALSKNAPELARRIQLTLEELRADRRAHRKKRK